MALQYPTFADLNANRLAILKELLVGVLQEYNTEIDLRRGTVSDLVLHPRALLTAVNEEAINNALSSSSLQAIIDDPTIADEDTVDRTLGNYRLVRGEGIQASGTVTIILSTLTPVIIPDNLNITISGVVFKTDQVYAARTSEGAVIGSGDRLLTAVTGGYAFTVNVLAETVGENGNVTRGTTATLEQNPPEFVKAFATSDFAGGRYKETNAALVNRLQTGLAVRAWSNRPSIEAVLLSQPNFANIKSVSIIGFLDAEMLRDQHSIFPVANGGRADLYVRTSTTYQTLSITKTATLVSKDGAVGTWQLGLAKDEAPGYYEIVKVLLPTADPTAAGFTPSSEVRSLDLTDDGWKPDLETVLEGTYSAYQSSVVQFVDTTTNATSLTDGVSQQDYDVVVRAMPLIGEIQTFWNNISNRPPMGDILVKAPIPCFTDVSFTLNIRRGYTVNTATVQQTVSDAVNALGFSGQVAASYLNQVLHNLLGIALLATSSMSIAGRIRNPNGTTTNLTSSTVITVADNFPNMVSGRTVAFLSEPSAIAVTIVTVDAPGV